MALLGSRRRKWLAGGLAAVILIVVALAFVPGWYLRGAIDQALTERGLRADGIESVGFNLFNLAAETGPVEIWRGDQKVISLSGLELFLQASPLMQQRIDVGGASLRGLNLTISGDDSGRITVSGLPALEQNEEGESEGSGWLLGLSRLELRDSTVQINLPQVAGTLQLDQLDLVNFKTWTPENPGTIRLRARFEGADLEADARISPFGEEINAEYDVAVSDLPLDRFDLGQTVTGVLTAALEGSAAVGDQTRLEASGNASISALQTAMQDGTAVSVEAASVDLSRLVLTQADALTLQADIRPTVQGAQIVLGSNQDGAQDQLVASLGDGEGTASLTYDGSAEGAFSGQGDLSLSAIQAGLTGGGTIGAADRLEVSQWQYLADGGLSASQVSLRGARGLDEADSALAIFEGLVLKNPAMAADGGISLESAVISGLAVNLGRGSDGFEGLGLLDRLPPGNPEAEPEPLRLAIGEIAFDDPATVIFADGALATPARQIFVINRFSLKDLDTAQGSRQSPLLLEAAINDQAQVALNGWIAPVDAPEPSFNVNGTVEGLELHNLSPYVASALGVNLRSGRLDIKLTGLSQQGALDAQTHWLIKKVELEDLDEFEQSSLEQAADVPIETAVNLLSDKQGTIEINVPIAGRLGDPQFDLTQTINKAINKAIGNAVKTTLKVVFPVMLLAEIGSGKKLQFDPVVFAPGTDDLVTGSTDKLRTVADLLDKRPKISITVCGVAANEDFLAARAAAAAEAAPVVKEPLEAAGTAVTDAVPPPPEPMTDEERAALVTLAQARTISARQSLIDEFGADPERVFECRARVDLEDGAPRAEVSI